MGLLTQANSGDVPVPDRIRLNNAAARQFDCYQGLLRSLLALRTGGKHTYLVQRMNVSDGGRVMVAGEVKTGAGHA